MTSVDTTPGTVETLTSRLHESHAVPVYEAIERLMGAAAAVGLDSRVLVRWLDEGKTLAEVLEIVESKMELAQRAA